MTDLFLLPDIDTISLSYNPFIKVHKKMANLFLLPDIGTISLSYNPCVAKFTYAIFLMNFFSIYKSDHFFFIQGSGV